MLGLLGLSMVGAAYLHSAVGSQLAVTAFKQAVAAESQQAQGISLANFSLDQSLWSDSARANYEKAKNNGSMPLALLKIGRLNLEAPVFANTDRITLNRGIGVIEGTAMPGEVGNIAMSAHRDSFFRPLKDIVIGDSVELHTLDAVQRFRVSEIRIVDPMDLSVLEPTETTVLTLITCYPFYFVGYAPDRFIVHATPVDPP